MIKPLTGIELASNKTRSGLTSIGELLPRLIRSYELQAELVQQRSQCVAGLKNQPSPAPISASNLPLTQATFSWF